jgi:hypothetical protein
MMALAAFQLDDTAAVHVAPIAGHAVRLPPSRETLLAGKRDRGSGGRSARPAGFVVSFPLPERNVVEGVELVVGGRS